MTVSLVDQITGHPIASAKVIQPYIIAVFHPILKIRIDQNDRKLHLLTDLSRLIRPASKRHQPLDIPRRRKAHRLLNAPRHIEHHVIPVLTDLFFQRSDDRSVKRIGQCVVLGSSVVIHNDSNDPGAIICQNPRAHIGNIIRTVNDILNLF